MALVTCALPLTSRQAALSSAMPSEFGGKWETECINTSYLWLSCGVRDTAYLFYNLIISGSILAAYKVRYFLSACTLCFVCQLRPNRWCLYWTGIILFQVVVICGLNCNGYYVIYKYLRKIDRYLIYR